MAIVVAEDFAWKTTGWSCKWLRCAEPHGKAALYTVVVLRIAPLENCISRRREFLQCGVKSASVSSEGRGKCSRGVIVMLGHPVFALNREGRSCWWRVGEAPLKLLDHSGQCISVLGLDEENGKDRYCCQYGHRA
jgi:hypothetical protein